MRIYLDIDRTLIDSIKVRELTRSGMCQSLGLNRQEVDQVIDGYTAQLIHKNDFHREKMLKIISEKMGIKYKILKEAHDKPIYYQQSLYTDVLGTLKWLKDRGHMLGIYSEGRSEYQSDKISLSGIKDYIEPTMVLIKKRKLRKEVVVKIGEAIIVDDNLEVIEYLLNFPKIKPIWINRINKKRLPNVETIFSLKEICSHGHGW